jgi:hypothetical protein
MYDLAKADKSQMTKVEELYYAAQQYITSEEEEVIESCDSITNDSTYSENTEYSEITYNTNFYIITGSNTDEFVVEYPALSECICTCDPVTLKTIVRANPGVIVLKDGIVIDKYNLKNKAWLCARL